MKWKAVFSFFCLVFGWVALGVSYGVQQPGSSTTESDEGEGGRVRGPVKDLEEMKAELQSYGRPAIFYAISDPFADVGDLTKLLQQGADPNEVWSKRGITVLQWVLLRKRRTSPTIYGKIKALLDYGANPNLPDEFGLTPMHYAAMWHNEAIMTALIEAGGDPSIDVYKWALRRGNAGAVAAIERVAKHTLPEDTRARLETRGAYSKAMAQVYEKSTTKEELKANLEKLVDRFVRIGYIPEARKNHWLKHLYETPIQGGLYRED